MSTLGKSYQDVIDQIDKNVEQAIKEAAFGKMYSEKRVIYTAYEMDEYDIPISNLDEVPVKGKIKFVSEDGEWHSPVLDSPTWLQIAVYANAMLIATDEFYFKYFDDFEVVDNENGIMIANFNMETN
jgi:hypothetical protein